MDGEHGSANESVNFEVTSADAGSVLLTVTGAIDMTTAAVLRQGLDDAFALSPRELIIDLSRVTVLSSSGIALLVHASNRLPGTAPLKIVADHTLERLMTLVGLDTVIAVHPTLGQARTTSH